MTASGVALAVFLTCAAVLALAIDEAFERRRRADAERAERLRDAARKWANRGAAEDCE